MRHDVTVAVIHTVDTPVLPLARLQPLIGDERYDALQAIAARAREQLAGVTIWNLNSTAAGGGVAEMLRVIVGYTLDVGVDTRWSVITADPAFFATSKRLHNQLHGSSGGGMLTAAAADHYRETTDRLGEELARQVRPGDVVLLHDPQTAGMATRLARRGAHVVWRCHIGVDHPNEWTERGWEFLRPHLESCERYIFSKPTYPPTYLPPEAIEVILPSIDPFSAKNAEMAPHEAEAVLQAIGVLAGDPDGRAMSRPVSGRAAVLSEQGPVDPGTPLVTQVSRWDRLKDMAGVMEGFADVVAGRHDAHLALVGPAVDAVSDDPEGAEVLEECIAAWRALPTAARARISLVTLPMDDLDANAWMVNAVQRHATVVVQKSIAEGFGLTVAEAMWKGRAVIASNLGGIMSQITPGTGVLLDDPTDLAGFGAVLAGLLANPAEIGALGSAARQRVLRGFLGDTHLIAYAKLVGELVLGSTARGEQT